MGITQLFAVAALIWLTILGTAAIVLHAYHSGRSGKDPIPTIPNPLGHKSNGEKIEKKPDEPFVPARSRT